MMSEEKRLIDANAFLKDILTAGIGKTIIEYSESDIGYMIRKRPTIDAVPVVRCKDCKHRFEDSWCEYVDDNDNFYCARGERREGSDNG